MSPAPRVLVTGGAGYVGAVLVPKLLAAGYRVRVLDLCWFGREVLADVAGHPAHELVVGDLRDPATVAAALAGCQAVIHLACISNDPSFELDPTLGKSINYDCFRPLLEASRTAGVQRFVYASSSSVYGIKEVDNVTEELPLEPLTDYSKYKALCEAILAEYASDEFCAVTVRPATVCGWSPRLRLDLTVNILTCHAWHKGQITVFGGEQRRPNIHIEDITDLYVDLLARPAAQVNGGVWNAGWENHRVREIAELVRDVIGPRIEIVTTPSDDHRSYHISSEKIRRDLGFVPRHSIKEAVSDLVAAFDAGQVPDALTAARYSNIKTMQALRLA
ncbi:MAG: SDR family oxidoreductase [Fimbriimonadaceae bacterium]|nr:SDR family oxidoreductase [Fimbriimonadaceae bacterium]